ncbi:MAG: AAA family ATPase, partial [Bacteroidota bacterium]
MRLKSIYISEYKNLKNFNLNFDGDSFIDVFVGKNGTGKSNLFEALIEIFRHLYEYDLKKDNLYFNYSVKYEINNKNISIEWKSGHFKINNRKRKTIGATLLPDNLLVYYSGHNETVKKLIRKYEDEFRKQIKEAEVDESRRFLGIGSDYKELLLAILLVQPDTNKAKKYTLKKLGIQTLGTELTLKLKRPAFANSRLKQLDVEGIDAFDSRTYYWGASGITQDFLDTLVACIKSAFNHNDIYSSENDSYQIPINIELFQEKFSDVEITDVFRQFDNLKTLNMLAEISVPIQLSNGINATTSYFSDGQFQSVYIYSIIELFKTHNCVTLLDEPDSFLHPEWQYEFLKQIFEITDTASKNNHVLMSSHSAVTLIPHDKRKIKFFDINNNQVNCYDLPKTIAIKKLSSDLIKYSEQEQLLSIINTIQIENKPVLFTEGSTDPIILKEAWYKLYEEEMAFIPFYAFSCTYINQLLRDDRIHSEMGGLPVFALFDFDKAYNQWNGLNGTVIERNPLKGMIKKWAQGESYAIMLPVPAHADIQRQVIKNSDTQETFGGESYCEIEHLFYGQSSTQTYYQSEPCVGGNKIVFKSDREKTAFSKEVVPNLDADCFEIFRP